MSVRGPHCLMSSAVGHKRVAPRLGMQVRTGDGGPSARTSFLLSPLSALGPLEATKRGTPAANTRGGSESNQLADMRGRGGATSHRCHPKLPTVRQIPFSLSYRVSAHLAAQSLP